MRTAATLRYETLWKTLHDAGAELVVNGHVHNYERFKEMNADGSAASPGLREIVVGTGGANLDGYVTSLSTTDVRNSSTYGVLKLILRPSNYSWQFVSVAGQTFKDSGNTGPGYLNYWNPNGVHRSDAVTDDGERIEGSAVHLARHFFDVYKIEYGILNPENILGIGLSPEPDYAAAQASAINDVFIEEWLPADPRFRYSIAVAPNDPELAAREIRRLGDRPGVVQVLMPSGARIPYGQRTFHPIYAAAAEHGLPIEIHPGTEGVGISGAPTAAGYPSSYLEWHTGLVGSFIAHLISLMTEGVFIKFPELKFVLVEGGVSWLPPLLWRLDKNWRALRQTVPWLDRRPSEIVFEHIYLTTQPIEEPDRPEHFKMMLEMFPADHMVMFSSDFPHWDGDMPDFAARNFPAHLRNRVMHETARCTGYRPTGTFHRKWRVSSPASGKRRYLVTRTGEIPPGARRIVELEGRSIGVFNVHGRYMAVLNVCPDEFAPVFGRLGGPPPSRRLQGSGSGVARARSWLAPGMAGNSICSLAPA